MVRRMEMTERTIQELRRCRFLIRYGVGVDNIDLRAATAAGIVVGHVPYYCEDEVSTHAIALLLACVRRLLPTHQKMFEGGWDVHRTDPIHRMAGRTLGLVGLGTLGRAVARKLRGWGLRILASDPYLDSGAAAEPGVELAPLERVLAEADFVSLHVPLLPETKHLISEESLARMKRGVVLVNTARGPVVDGEALLRALDSGQVSCAALDVFEEEPLALGSPLRKHPRLLATDHTAWYSEESQIDLQRKVGREVARFARGELPEAIANPEVLEQLGRAGEWTPNYLAQWQARRKASGR